MTDTIKSEAEATPSPRKIVQIATAMACAASGDTYQELCALCDDGTIWRNLWADQSWERLPPIPQEQDNE